MSTPTYTDGQPIRVGDIFDRFMNPRRQERKGALVTRFVGRDVFYNWRGGSNYSFRPDLPYGTATLVSRAGPDPVAAAVALLTDAGYEVTLPPEPEPRFYIHDASDYCSLRDRERDCIVATFWSISHPDAAGAAKAEADRLNALHEADD